MLKGLKAPRKRTETKTMSRLRARMAEVTTWVQFEEIVATSPEGERGAIRRLLEPLLRQDLPCCGPAQLSIVTGQTAIAHAPRCPANRRVVLAVN